MHLTQIKEDIALSIGPHAEPLTRLPIFDKICRAYKEFVFGFEDGSKITRDEYLEVLMEWQWHYAQLKKPSVEKPQPCKIREAYLKELENMDLRI